MHRLSTECRAILHRTLSAAGQWPTITLSNVKGVIDVAVEAPGAVIPRPCTDK